MQLTKMVLNKHATNFVLSFNFKVVFPFFLLLEKVWFLHNQKRQQKLNDKIEKETN
jgi:hypothetical protein